MSSSGAAAMARLQKKASSAAQTQCASVSKLQSEDEALAWALQQSLYEADLKDRSGDQHTNRRRSSRQRSDKSCFVS